MVDSIHNPCPVQATLRAPGQVPHVQPQSPVFLVASLHTDCVYAAGPILVLARDIPGHTSASCGRFFFCPWSCGTCAICSRDAHHSWLAGKNFFFPPPIMRGSFNRDGQTGNDDYTVELIGGNYNKISKSGKY